MQHSHTPRSAEWEQTVRVSPWADIVFSTLPTHRTREAIVFPERRVTYDEFAAGITRRARSLLALGIQNGDHVGILMPNSIEFLEILYASAAIGAVAVVLNARFRAHELRYTVENSDVRTLFTVGVDDADRDFRVRLAEAFPALAGQNDARNLSLSAAPRLRTIVLVGGTNSALPLLPDREFDRLADAVEPLDVHRRRQSVRIRDPFLMLYTSGTTSVPKACVHTHESIIRNVHWVCERYGIVAGDRFWSPLPLSHLTSIFVCASMMMSGGTFPCMPFFEPGAALRMLEKEHASIAIMAFPAIINDLLDHPDKDATDLSSLRVVMSNAAVQPETVQRRLREAFPNARNIGTYAMTETAGAGACVSVYDEGEDVGFRSLGTPMPGMNIRVVGPDGIDRPIGERGEILINGFGLFEGYYRDPDRTSAVLPDGWLHTGDIGSFDERGELMFYGRIKDMLRVGGENVASSEIEEFLHTHPAVRQCQVVGAPDPRLSEVPAAFIELADGASVTSEEIVAFCTGKIAGYKVPRYVCFVSDWPLTASSKIQKHVLAARIAELIVAAAH